MAQDSSGVLRPAEPPVRRAIVAICEKCGKKIAPGASSDDNPSRLLQKRLKGEFAQAFGGKGEVRPVVSSCMDVCPDGEITVGVFRLDDPTRPVRFFTFLPEDADEVGRSVLQVLGR